jgi:hypothetical protein
MGGALRAGRSAIATSSVVLAIICLLLCSFSPLAQAKTEEEWKERTVYQIVSYLTASEHNARHRTWVSTAVPSLAQHLTPTTTAAAAATCCCCYLLL